MVAAIYIFISVLYICFVFVLIYFWSRIPAYNPASAPSSLSLSVIIAIRNEAQNLPFLLNDLDMQTEKEFEVIIVDDHSDDGSKVIAEDILRNSRIARYKVILNAGTGKKHAIKSGIAVCESEIILTTDGDCRVHPRWVGLIAKFFEEKNAVMVIGAVGFKFERSFFSKIQQIEFASLIGTGASCLRAGFPNMCNGANLAYSKKAFQQVHGFEGNEDVPSGDDEFLMHKIFKLFPGKVFFLKNSDSLVLTNANQDLKSFYNQRKRWGGKWDRYAFIHIKLLALFVFLYNFSLLAGLCAVIGGYMSIYVYLIPLSLKILAELVFLRNIYKLQTRPFDLMSFLALQVVYPFYILFFGMMSKVGGYSWKGRNN
ncbi:MAG: glycosyltransferase [Cytophagaceae bacterium]